MYPRSSTREPAPVVEGDPTRIGNDSYQLGHGSAGPAADAGSFGEGHALTVAEGTDDSYEQLRPRTAQAQAAGMFTPIEARRKNILLPATLPWKYARVTDIMTLLESAFSQGQSWIGTDFVKLKGEALVKGLLI